MECKVSLADGYLQPRFDVTSSTCFVSCRCNGVIVGAIHGGITAAPRLIVAQLSGLPRSWRIPLNRPWTTLHQHQAVHSPPRVLEYDLPCFSDSSGAAEGRRRRRRGFAGNGGRCCEAAWSIERRTTSVLKRGATSGDTARGRGTICPMQLVDGPPTAAVVAAHLADEDAFSAAAVACCCFVLLGRHCAVDCCGRRLAGTALLR